VRVPAKVTECLASLAEECRSRPELQPGYVDSFPAPAPVEFPFDLSMEVGVPLIDDVRSAVVDHVLGYDLNIRRYPPAVAAGGEGENTATS
jgi:hypothetical protein